MTRYRSFVVLLCSILSTFGLDVEIIEDETIAIGRGATLVCEAFRVDGRIIDCRWKSPNVDIYSARDRNNGRRYRVFISKRSDTCYLDIDHAAADDSGVWECIMEDEQGAKGAFAFLNVVDPSETGFQVLIDVDEQFQQVVQGNDVELVCPSNHIVYNPGDRAICSWFDPNGKSYVVVDRRGAIYHYEKDDIVFSGNPDRGECGITVKNIKINQSGRWKCQLIRASSWNLGSEITSSYIDVDVYRSAKYQEPEMLQGYQEGDENVSIVMSIPPPTDAIRRPIFYWVLRRKFIIYEGEELCPDSRSRCYRALDSEYFNDDLGKYIILTLEIEELDSRDLDYPLALIMEYRVENYSGERSKFVSRVFKVPRKTPPVDDISEIIDQRRRPLSSTRSKNNDKITPIRI